MDYTIRGPGHQGTGTALKTAKRQSGELCRLPLRTGFIVYLQGKQHETLSAARLPILQKRERTEE